MKKEHQFSKSLKAEILEIIDQYENKRAAIIPALHRAQEQFGYISQEIEKQVAEILSLPLIKVREVVSFYSMFSKKPLGKHQIQICQNMSCSLRGAEEIIDYIKDKLNVEIDGITNDEKYTLKTVECLGACEMAPMMRLDKQYIGNLTKEKIKEIIKGLS